MGVDHLFCGNALAALDARGRLLLPAFIRAAADRGSDAQAMIIGPHEIHPCLTGYAHGYAPFLFGELERRRLRDEAAGAGAAAHHARAHLFFGAPEPAPYDSSGRMVIPLAMRRKGRIDDLALFVGAGGTFEIWNPDLAREAGDEALRELAAWRLDELSLTTS
jgi:MraZ protein